ncbi:MAG: DUF58 domain-containing protein [Roseburia sp.]|nr:DUF58 domain-containing protein [Roseburia sp.]
MKKLLFFVLIAASYYIAGMYRQLPLMIFTLMEWLLLLSLILLSRCLRQKLTLSVPAQSDEAEKGCTKKCLIRITRAGKLPLKKVCIQMKLYDDTGALLERKRVCGALNAPSGMMELSFCPSHCGMMRIQICKISVYDYLSLFSASKSIPLELPVTVLPRSRALTVSPSLGEAAADRPEELPLPSDRKHFGNESRDIRQIREYRTGDMLRYVHWNQSAKTGKLWFKEFEPEDEPFFELLLDLMLPEDWQRERQDGFYELAAALVLGLLQSGHRVRVCWYSGKISDFIIVLVTGIPEYRGMMRQLYQSGFVAETNAVQTAYENRQSRSGGRLLKCNLRLECYDVTGRYGEELRHQFTYENLEQELSGNSAFSLR